MRFLIKLIVIEPLEISLLAITALLAILAIELKNLFYMAISFLGVCISIAILYWLLGASLVALFQIAIYAGAIVVLIVMTILLTERGAE